MKKKILLLVLILVLIATFSVALFACKDQGNKAHEHVYGEWQIEESPGKTTTGSLVRYCTEEGCSARQSYQLPKLNDKDYTYSKVDATYDEEGKETYVFEKDGKSFTFEVNTGRLLRKYGAWELISAPNYENEGQIKRISLDEDKIEETFTLPKFNLQYYKKKIIKDSTCTETGKAKLVFEKDNQKFEFEIEIPLKEHNYTRWEHRAPGNPTVLYDSYIERYCKDCHKVEKKTLPALKLENVKEGGYIYKEIKPYSCTQEGEGQFIFKIDNQEFSFTAKVPAQGHKAGEYEIEDPTFEKAGRAIKRCTVCNEIVEEIVLPKLDDVNYNHTFAESTCGEKGWDKYVLNAHEGFEYTFERELSSEHAWTEWKCQGSGDGPYDWPTANKVGKAVRHCTICGKSEEHILPKITDENIGDGPWQYTEVTDDTDPTKKWYTLKEIPNTNFYK